MRFLLCIALILALTLTISGCEQNVNSEEIKKFDVLYEDTIENSSATIKFTVIKPPGKLSLSEDLSDIGIYLDDFNVGNYSVKSIRNGSQVNITVVVDVDREKLMSWWAGNVRNKKSEINLTLKAYPTFNLENGLLLRTMYQKSGKLYLPLFNQSVNISPKVTEIAYPACGEIKKCNFFINGVNVTQGCYVNNTSCMVVQSLNNTRLIDALSSHLLNGGTIRYEVHLLAGGKMLEIKGEREFKAVFEG